MTGLTGELLRQPPDPAAIRIEGLRKTFSGRRALNDLDLAVAEGAVYVLVGPNGAGKTTTLRALLDLVRIERGDVRVLGREVAGVPEVRGRIGWVPEGRDIPWGRMSVGTLLDHHAAYFEGWDTAYARRLERALDIDRRPRFDSLSKGEARRVQLVMAMSHRPSLLLLDEPTDGLDPLARSDVLALLADHLASTATTVLVSTHVIHEVEGLGDWLGVMKRGRLVAQLPRDEMSRRLLRVRARVASGWAPETELEPWIVLRRQRGREVEWVVWSPAEEVRRTLAGSELSIREIEPLGLEEAANALLRMEDS